MKDKLDPRIRKVADSLRSVGASLSPMLLASKIREIDLPIPASGLALLISTLPHTRTNFVPQFLTEVIRELAKNTTARLICDPWAGFGAVVATIEETISPEIALAFTRSADDAAVGQAIGDRVQWQVGEPIELLAALKNEIGIACSVLPFGLRAPRPFTLRGFDGQTYELRDDLGHLILVAASLKLTADGIGIFVVPQSFFLSRHSVFRSFDALGLGVEAALGLPSGAFAPLSNISTYLVLVRKRVLLKMFVAELSTEPNTNVQIIANLKQGIEGGTLELGRIVDPKSFVGLDVIRWLERLGQAARKFGVPAIRLGELATEINLGHNQEQLNFETQNNAVYIPLIGVTDVVDSADDLKLKRQNYAQIVVDPTRSDARFVARFFNSEFGKELRELNKSGAVIPKLNKQTLKNLQVFVPDLQTQKTMLEIEAKITAEQNTLLGLENELAELRRALWSEPKSAASVNQRVIAVSSRLSASLKEHTVETLDRWFETLPFPLATILRAWQATSSQDFKTKYEHLLHFFEATAEFVSVILLSAFSSNEALFQSHKPKLSESLHKQNVNFQRATFGTWKLVVEYFGKQTRQLLEADKDTRAQCGDIFADPSFVLPVAVSRKELAPVLSTTNKMRNDWSGHGGVVGQEEARFRNEQLLTEVQKLREIFADAWIHVQMIRAVSTQLRRGVFENEIAILMGSNSEFRKEPRSMSMCLDVEQLYLAHKDANRALRLLPLIKLESSPRSAKNACYFFSKVEREGLKYVSYHYIDQPELTGQFEDASEAMKLLSDD